MTDDNEPTSEQPQEPTQSAKAAAADGDTITEPDAAAAADVDATIDDADKEVECDDDGGDGKRSDEVAAPAVEGNEKKSEQAEEMEAEAEEEGAPENDSSGGGANSAKDASAATGTENTDNSNTEGKESASAGSKRKEPPFDFELPKEPTTVKKARSAYFIFVDNVRPGIVEKNPGKPVGDIAKMIGDLWGKLTPEEKQPYQTQALEEKERVAYETETLREAGLLLQSSGPGSGKGPGTGFVLPVARIRKIVKLDPEVKGTSKEGIQLITKAGELFLASLGKNAVQVATLQNRRKLVPDDILQVCETKKEFMFLNEDIRVLVEDQKQEQRKKEKASEEAKAKAASEANAGVKTLTSFFAPSNVASAGN